MTRRAYLQVNLVIVDDAQRTRSRSEWHNVPRVGDTAVIEIPITHATGQVADLTTRVAVLFRELRDRHHELRPTVQDPVDVCRAERAKRAKAPDPAAAAIAAARDELAHQDDQRRTLKPIRVGARA